MIKPGRAGAGCTQFPFFMRRYKSCQRPQTNWLSLKSALKGPNYHYFYAAGTCIGWRLCLEPCWLTSVEADKPISDEGRILRFRPHTYFAKCLRPLLLFRHRAV